MAKVYRNKNWTKRNYDCTNIVMQVVQDGGKPRHFNGTEDTAGAWVETNESVERFEEIGGFGQHRFYGFM